MPDGYGVGERSGEVGLGVAHRPLERVPAREAAGDRRRERAARAMGSPSGDALLLEPHAACVPLGQAVGRLALRVAALDKDGAPQLPAARSSRPVSLSASGMFGVTSVTWGMRSSTSTEIASGASRGAPDDESMTGSSTMGEVTPSSATATACTVRASPSIPTLIAFGMPSSRTASICCRTKRGSSALTAVTPVVLWAVSTAGTASAYRPWVTIVLMSACMPAPPLGSDPAMLSTDLGRNGLAVGLALTRPPCRRRPREEGDRGRPRSGCAALVPRRRDRLPRTAPTRRRPLRLPNP